MSRLKITWRRGTAYATGTIAGQRVRRSLGTGSQAQAEQLIASLEARLWKGHIHGPEAVVTFAEAATDYMKAGGQPDFLTPLIRHFGTWTLSAIKPGHITAAAPVLYPGRKPATWNRQVITPARAVINHGHQMGWCAPIRVRRFAEQKPHRVAVDRAWIDRFITAADKRGQPHLGALALFMFQTAARISEALSVTWDDVDLKQRTVAIACTKTGEARLVHITSEMMIVLANLPRQRPPFRYPARTAVYGVWRRTCKAAEIDYVPPHQAGRHSAATQAVALGIDTPTAMQALGWKSSRLFIETYAHPDNPGRRLADAMDGTNLPHKHPMSSTSD